MSKQVKVSGKEFLIDFEGDDRTIGTLNGLTFRWDVSRISDTVYHVIKDHRSYEVEVANQIDGKRQLKVNGILVETETIDRFEALLKKMGMEKGAASKVNELKAPMPGLVLSIDVKPGDVLKKGDRILVLEAMKMENVIKATADVIIASIEVEKGKTVDKNQVMVKFGG